MSTNPDTILAQLLSPTAVYCQVEAATVKRLLEHIGMAASAQDRRLDPTLIAERLLARERLGGTGLTQGIAIPHCRCQELDQPMLVLLQLQESIDFSASDRLPVDIFFALLFPASPTPEDLQILAAIAQKLREPRYRDDLRNAKNAAELYAKAIA